MKPEFTGKFTHRGEPIYSPEKTSTPMNIEVTKEEADILAKIRDLIGDEMLATGMVESCATKLEYEDGHVLKISWHKEDPDDLDDLLIDRDLND